MVGVVSGNGLGLFNTSLDLLGNAHGNPTSLGQAKGSAYVNAATGNLSVQFLDESLSGKGADLFALRTYNSLGAIADGDADAWRWSGEKKLVLSGTRNDINSTVSRTLGDGSTTIFTWSATQSRYSSTDGSGAHDILTWNSSTSEWEFKEDGSTTTEFYDGTTGWIKRSRDNTGSNVGFDYRIENGILKSITDIASSQRFDFIYDGFGGRLSELKTYTVDALGSNAELLKQVSYEYYQSGAQSGMLRSVTTDLTPTELADNKIYVTSYEYDTNKRLTKIDQSVNGDGTSASFEYYADGRVWKVIDQTGITTFTYDIPFTHISPDVPQAITRVSNELGNTWEYRYQKSNGYLRRYESTAVGGTKQSAEYTYDTSGNVKTITDGRNNVITYDYDVNGNRTKEVDGLGNTITRTFGAANRVSTETRYSDTSLTSTLPIKAETTRYVYDTANRLRFVISPEGRVSETRYNSRGLVTSTHQYAATSYTGSTATLTDLTNWVTAATTDKTQIQLSEFAYDYRGNLIKKTSYAKTDVSGNGVFDTATDIAEYTYSAHGQLLQTIRTTGAIINDVNGGKTRATRTVLSSSLYDGMGRQFEVTQTSTNHLNEVFTSITTTEYAGPSITVTNKVNGIQTLTTVSTTDASGRLTSLSQSGSNGAGTNSTRITNYYYDAAGQLRMTQDPTGARTYLFYDAAGRVNGKVDAAGAATVYTHDADGRVLTETRYANVISAATLTTWGTNPPASLTPPTADTANDRKTTYEYDNSGRLKSTQVDGGTEKIINDYDGASRLTQTTQGARITKYYYDKDGRQIGTLDAEKSLVENQYDHVGRLIKTIRYGTAVATVGEFVTMQAAVASGLSLSTHYYYDSQGRLTGSVNEQGFLSTIVYDAALNRRSQIQYMTAVTVPANATLTALIALAGTANTTTTQYDTLGRVDSVTTQDGTISRNIYDGAGRLVRQIQAEGTTDQRASRTQYNAFGEVTGVVSGVGEATLIASATDAQITTAITNYGTTIQYDGAGRKVTEIQPNGQKTFLFYNAAGQLTYTVNALGEVAKTLYNAFGQVKEVYVFANRLSAANLAPLTTGGLDTVLAGKLPSGHWSMEQQTVTTYNKLGLVATVNANEAITTNTYNIYGQLETATQRISSTANTVTRFNYDLMGRIKNTIRDDGGLGATNSVIYDGFGRVRYTTDANGRITETKYNLNGREIEILDPLGRSRKTQIDAQGRTVKSYDGLGNITSYSYDDANRTFTVTSPDGVSIVTTKSIRGETLTVKDGNGGITTYAYTKDGKLDTVTNALGVMTTDNTYDNSGRLYESKDANGVITRYTYDAANRVTQKAVDPTGLNIRTSYEFDGAGRQIRVTEGVGTAEASATEYRYNYQNKIGYIIVDPSGLKLATQFTYDDTGNTLTVSKGVFNTTTNNITTVDQITQYVFDKLGRTQFVVDAEGAVTENIYDANGNIVSTTQYDKKINTSIVMNESNIKMALASWSQDFSVNAAGLSLAASTMAVSNGQLVLSSTKTAAGTPPEFPQAWGATRPVGTAFRYEFSTDGSTGAHYGTIGINATDWSRRHVLNQSGNTFYTEFADVNGVIQYVPIGTIKNNTNYVLEIETDSNGSTLYLYEKGQSKSQAIVDRRNIGGWNNLATWLLTLRVDSLVQSSTTSIDSIQEFLPSQSRKTQFIYDNTNRLKFTVDAEGAVTENIYDANGNIVSTTQYDKKINTSIVMNESNIKTALASWAQDFSVNAAGLTIDPTGFRVENGYLVMVTEKLPQGSPTGFPQINGPQEPVGTKFRYEFKTDNTPGVEWLTLGIKTGNAHHVLHMNGGSLIGSSGAANPQGTSGDYVIGTIKDNHNYVMEIETDANGSTLYLYEKGASRTSGVIDRRNYTNNSFVHIHGMSLLQDGRPMTSYLYIDSIQTFRPDSSRTTNFVYDKTNRLRFTVDAEGAVTENIYDANGNIVSTTQYDKKINTSIVMNESNIKMALASWSQDFSVNATGYSLDPRNFTVSNGQLVMTTTKPPVGTPVEFPQSWGASRQIGTSFRYEFSTDNSTNSHNAYIGVNASDWGRRHVLCQNGAYFFIEWIDATGTVKQQQVGTIKDNTKYVLEIETDLSGSTLYLYEAGSSKNSGIVDRRDVAGWMDVRTWLMTGIFDFVSKSSNTYLENVQEFFSAEVRKTQFVYDRANRLKFTVNAEGAVSENIYDANGNIVSTTQYDKKINTSIVMNESNIKMALASWSQDFSVNAAGLSLSATNFSVANGQLVMKTNAITSGSSTFPQTWGTAREIGTSFRYEFATDGSTNAHYATIGINATDWSRRHAILQAGGTFYVEYIDATGTVKSQVLGNIKDNTSYVIEIETDSNGSTLYLYEQGGSRTTGYIDRRDYGNWKDAATWLLVGNVPSYNSSTYLNSIQEFLPSQSRKTQFIYDKANRLQFTVNAEGAISENVYDARGNVVRTIQYANKLSASDMANVTTLNTIGTNRLNNSTFSNPDSNGVPEGWVLSYTNVAPNFASVTINPITGFPAGDNTLSIYQGNIGPAGTKQELSQSIASIIPGKRYVFSSYTGSYGATVSAHIMWYHANGTLLGSSATPAASQNTHEKIGGAALSGYKRLVAEGIAPSGAVKAVVILRKGNTSVAGTTDSWMHVVHAQFEEVPLANSQPTDWVKALIKPIDADRTTNFVYDAANRLRFSINAENAVTETKYDALGNVKEIIQYANKLYSVAGSPTLSELTMTTNRLNNAYFAEPGTNGAPANWVRNNYNDAHTGSFGVNLAGAENLRSGLQPEENVFYIKQTATNGSFPGSYQELTQIVPVATGKHYAFSVSVGSKGVAPEVLIRWLDGNGNVISTDTAGSIYITNGVFLTRVTVKNTAPAGAVQAQLVLKKTVGVTETHLYAARPQFEELPSLTSNATNWVKSAIIFPHENDRKTVYEYDKAGRQTKTIMAGWYDVSDGMVYGNGSDTDRFQRTIEVKYDALGNAVSNKIRIGISDYIYQYKTYDKVGREVNDIDGMGHVTQKTYDALGNVKTVTRSASKLSVKTSGYWLNTDIATLTGRTITFDYDKVGRQIKVTQPTTGTTGYRSQETASTNGPLSAYNYSAAAVTEFVYDALGNLTKQTQLIDNAGRKAENYFYYDKLGRQIWSIDAEKYATKTLYDALGNVSSTREYATQLSSIPASVSALESTVTHAKDRVNSFTYDKLGQVKTTTRSINAINNGSVVTSTITEAKNYNVFGNVVETIDAMSNSTKMEYNRLGNLTKVTEPLRVVAGITNNDVFVNQINVSPVTTFTYNIFGESTEQTRSAAAASGIGFGQAITIKHIFDVAGNEIQTIDGEGNNSYSLYDVGGRVIAQKQGTGLGIERRFEYDKAGRQTATYDIYDSGAKKTGQYNKYNVYGEIEEEYKVWGAASATTSTLMATATSNAIVNRYEYDNAGRIKLKQGSEGFIYYYFDLTGKITRIEQRETATNTTTQRVTENYYDLLGRTTVQRLPQYAVTTSNFEIIPVENPQPSTSVLTPKLVNTYDRWGNTLTRRDAAEQITTYTYNQNNQVLSEVGPKVSTITLANTTIETKLEHQIVYDKLGRAVQDKYIAQQVNAYGATIATLGTHTNTNFYNNAGQLIETVDAMYNGDSYYNEFGDRPVSNPAANAGHMGVRQYYAYDIHGNKVGSRDGIGYVKVDTFNRNSQVTNNYILRQTDTAETSLTAEYKSTGIQTVNPVRVKLSTYTYDSAGRKYQEIDAKNKTTTFSYDERNNLTRISTGVYGSDKTYEYDELGNKIAEKQLRPGYNTINPYEVLFSKAWNFKESDGIDFTNYKINLAKSHFAYSYNSVVAAGYSYTYTGFGQLDTETYNQPGNSSAIKYTYYSNGLQDTIRDTSTEYVKFNGTSDFLGGQGDFTTTITSKYYYDIKGNRTVEVNNTTLDESAHIETSRKWSYRSPTITYTNVAARSSGTKDLYSFYRYDNQNRLTSTINFREDYKIDGVDFETSNINGLQYQYDEWGNRRKISSNYIMSDSSFDANREEWFTYNAANQVEIEGGINYNGTIGFYKDSNGKSQGIRYQYDAAGRRRSEEYWYRTTGDYRTMPSYDENGNFLGYGRGPEESYHLFNYTYNDLSLVSVVEKKFVARVLGQNSTFDPIVRNSNFNPQETNTYDNRGFKTKTVFHNKRNDFVEIQYDSQGRLLSNTTWNSSKTLKRNELTGYSYTPAGEISNYVYRAFKKDSLEEDFNNTYSYSYAQTLQGRQVTSINVTTSQDGTDKGTTTNRYDLRGRMVSSRITEAHLTDSSKTGDSYLKFVYNASGQILVKAEDRYDGSSVYKTQHYYYAPKGGELANIGVVSGINISPLTAISKGGDAPTTYTVNAGDTLMGISQTLFGDSKFWYLIADANDLAMGPMDYFDSELIGKDLRIPNNDKNISNTSDNWKPYNPSEVIGDLTPDPTILPPKKNSCETLVKIVSVVVQIIVTVVVTAVTGDPNTGAAAGASAGNYSQQYLQLMANGDFDWKEFGKGLINPFRGDRDDILKSRFDPLYWGGKDKIDYESIAISAGAAYIGGKVGGGGFIGGATTYAANYGLNRLAGNDPSFSLRAMMVSAVASGVLKAVGGKATPNSSGNLSWGNFNWSEFVAQSMEGIKTSAASAAVNYAVGKAIDPKNTHWDGAGVLIDAFGNALASQIVKVNSEPSAAERRTAEIQKKMDQLGAQLLGELEAETMARADAIAQQASADGNLALTAKSDAAMDAIKTNVDGKFDAATSAQLARDLAHANNDQTANAGVALFNRLAGYERQSEVNSRINSSLMNNRATYQYYDLEGISLPVSGSGGNSSYLNTDSNGGFDFTWQEKPDSVEWLSNAVDQGYKLGYTTTSVTNEFRFYRNNDYTDSKTVAYTTMQWDGIWKNLPPSEIGKPDHVVISSKEYKYKNVVTGSSSQTRTTQVDSTRMIDSFSGREQKLLKTFGHLGNAFDYGEVGYNYAISTEPENVRIATAFVDGMQVAASSIASGAIGTLAGLGTTLIVGAAAVPTTAGVGTFTVAPAAGWAVGTATAVGADYVMDKSWENSSLRQYAIDSVAGLSNAKEQILNRWKK